MTDLNARAVLTGSLVDILGSFVVGAIFFGLVGAAAGSATPEQLAALMDGSVGLQLASLALGLLMTGIGAYVAARLAAGAERTHAFAVGVISTVFGFALVFGSPESSPFWLQATGLILTIPAAFAGGEARRATAPEEGPRP